jgi:hypothetical protein
MLPKLSYNQAKHYPEIGSMDEAYFIVLNGWNTLDPNDDKNGKSRSMYKIEMDKLRTKKVDIEIIERFI